jgi:hypothetical protein
MNQKITLMNYNVTLMNSKTVEVAVVLEITLFAAHAARYACFVYRK